MQEKAPGFDPAMRDFKVTRPTTFSGVWQSPHYFDDLDMREVFRFPDELTKPLEDEAATIRSANAVCLGVRRYEEVKNQGPRIMQQDYFLRAMERIEQEVENPHYFVFAQDMDWAREHISSRHPVTYAKERDPHDGVIQDLFLMTQCRHFILSNSTLHWWAAWLGCDDGKVIAPAEGWPNEDMLPDSWDTMQ